MGRSKDGRKSTADAGRMATSQVSTTAAAAAADGSRSAAETHDPRVTFSMDLERNMAPTYSLSQAPGSLPIKAEPLLNTHKRPGTPNLIVDTRAETIEQETGFTPGSGLRLESPASAIPAARTGERSPQALGIDRSNTLPARTSARLLHESNPSSPSLSPRSRDRGYSLRRSVFARTINNSNENEASVIELTEAGSSSQVSKPTSEHAEEDTQDKKSVSRVVVTPGTAPFPLPPRPQPKKSTFKPSLRKYDSWVEKGRKYQVSKNASAAYERARKIVLRIKEIPPSQDGRHIDLNASRKTVLVDDRTGKDYTSNMIRSTRYTAYTFVPRQLVFQFSKLANFYFLTVSILQMIPGLSTTGTYTTIIPLLIFVCISMTKEGYDDLRRAKLDKRENNQETSVLHAYQPVAQGIPGQRTQDSVPPHGVMHWATLKWNEVKVGDIIRLERNDPVPADIVLLHSDGPNGVAFIETMALDGETNLKSKQAPVSLASRCNTLEGLVACDAHFVVEDPNLDLYNFDGKVTVGEQTLPLTSNEIVYRGSVLRNTSEALGMVINTGEECKIRMNATKNPRIKAPTLQSLVNRVVFIIVVFVVILALYNTIAYYVWANGTEDKAWYLTNAGVSFFPILISFVIMFNTMIPLSLYVSLEIIKVGQMFLMNDVDMYDPVSDTPMEARTTAINEELGQINYIFSDKTGTLTDNTMQFRKMSVAGTAWLHDVDMVKEEAANNAAEAMKSRCDKGKGRAKRLSRRSIANATHTPAESNDTARGRDSHTGGQAQRLDRSSSVASRWKSTARPSKAQPELNTQELLRYLQHKPHSVFAKKAKFFLLSLALCHTCLPEVQEDGKVDFQAASPDELALVRAAQELGYLVVDRPAQSIVLRTYPNGPDAEPVQESYEVLDIIEFSSKRKRMSIVVRFPNGRICIFCKGADSHVMPRLKHASLALQKAVEVERRASVRKSLEAEEALRRMSEQDESRNSFGRLSLSIHRPSMSRKSSDTGLPDMGRKSFSGLGRNSIGGLGRSSLGGLGRGDSMNSHKLQLVRDELDSWLTERERDVDMTSVDDPGAYTTPRSSLALSRMSYAPSERRTSIQDDGHYYDSLIDEAMVLDDSAVFERCFQHINDFATEGLRTLLYGYRFLDKQEYEGWKKVYLDATTSLVDRQDLIERAGELIEQGFDLAGATAIEDKLQNGVPETIDKLRRANIKMWMLTGDKRETAINIGHSCRLIKDYSAITILDHETGGLEQMMASAVLDISKGGVAHSVVVIDGQTLSAIENDEALSMWFFDLAILVDSVICCRASPSQKASLVKTIRTRVKKSITLAIGDGANDIAMIQEAHVGIGITGKEGLQAARTSDYSIAQFRFLQKLLLVHGRWNYVRTGKYVLNSFWKETMFYLTMASYQHYAGYTGTSFYESWSLSMFNTLFTALPVIALGVFEKDLDATTLLAVPELYTQGQRNEAFNVRKYVGWMFVAVCDSILIFFTVFALFGEAPFSSEYGIFATSNLAFTACVIIINTKILYVPHALLGASLQT